MRKLKDFVLRLLFAIAVTGCISIFIHFQEQRPPQPPKTEIPPPLTYEEWFIQNEPDWAQWDSLTQATIIKICKERSYLKLEK